MTPVAKQSLLLSLIGLIIIIVVICLTPSIRSRLTGIIGPLISQGKSGNDRFEDAEEITGPSGSIERSNARANKEGQPDEPNHRGLPPCRSIWFRWEAPSDGGVIFSTERSAVQTAVAVYDAQTIQAIPKSPSIILNPENDYLKFAFNAKRKTVYRIVVNGRNCGSSSTRNSGGGRQNVALAGTSEYKAFYTSAEKTEAADSSLVRLEWEMQSKTFRPAVIVGKVRDANCSKLSEVELTFNPCASNPSLCANHPCNTNPALCVEKTGLILGSYSFSVQLPIDDFTITPSFDGYNFIPESPGKPCVTFADSCNWTSPSCRYPQQGAGNQWNADYIAYRNPSLAYHTATTGDLVGYDDPATSPNGHTDGIFELVFPAGSAHPQRRRKITKMELTKSEGGTWDTATNGYWVLGVTDSVNGPLLNDTLTGNLSVPIPVDNGTRLYLFAADIDLGYFDSGSFTVTISFEDGGVATASYTISPTPAPTIRASP
jgi:hypothetical protein